MATVSIDIPDAIVPRVRAAMRAQFPEFNALGDAAAFRAATAKMWREILATQEGSTAAAAAVPAYMQAYDTAASAARAAAAGIG